MAVQCCYICYNCTSTVNRYHNKAGKSPRRTHAVVLQTPNEQHPTPSVILVPLNSHALSIVSFHDLAQYQQPDTLLRHSLLRIRKFDKYT
jgi:hypothetical protein